MEVKAATRSRMPACKHARTPAQPPMSFTLITGASQGLGLALAEACARRGKSLALARRRLPVDTLINNAGISHHGPFREAPPEFLQSLLDLNIGAVVRLTRLLLPELERHRQAHILNVASLAAFHAMPHKAVYAPSKTFVLNFTLALREELRGTGVRASALCPGGMRTNRTVRALIDSLGFLARLSSQEPAAVADYALRRLERGRAVIVPGAFNRATWFLGALFPRPLVLAFIRRRLRGPV
jgi:short-subunit dehydrogenase